VSKGLQSIDRYLSARARGDVAQAIVEADGNEVFFVGRPGDSGLIEEVEVHCRGHRSAVPALKQVGRPGEVVIHNHPSGHLSPSDPDLDLASHYGQEGVGFFIVDNEATAIYVVVEPLRESRRQVADAEVEAALSGAGGLPDLLPGYEPRDGQVALAQAVARAQNEGRVLVAEAGTGTGKSLAYLLPSAIRASGSGERVVVATRTRHLQQQLLDQDVPLLRRLDPQIQVAILKGRGNYLCRRKLSERLKEVADDGEAEEREFLEQVRSWSEVSRDGDLDDLPFVPDNKLWELVESSTDHTLRVRCPHYEECFYYNSRRRAAQANLLLVNHHLLMADIVIRKDGGSGLLPRYDHVVLDEAHHLEDAVTDFAGKDASLAGIMRQIGRLRPTRGRSRGLAMKLRQALDGNDGREEAFALREAATVLLERAEAARADLRLQLEDVAEAVLDAVRGGTEEEEGPRGARRPSASLRVTDDFAAQRPGLSEILQRKLDMCVRELSELAIATEKARQALDAMPEGFKRRHVQVGMDLGTVQRRLVDAAACFSAVQKADPGLVRWIEVRPGWQDVPEPRFVVRPLSVREVVQETVLPGARSVVATSATLTVAGSFGHFLERTGLDASERLDTKQIPSPFDYKSQVFLGIPSDLPEPGAPGWVDGVVESTQEAVRICQGRTFVLFTSYRTMHEVADRVGAGLGREFTLLRQGEMPRERLLELFRAGRRVALFGTDSFWEGVDVRGEALSCVILPRLPFRVPTEPLQVARAEAIDKAGGDSFTQLSVPQAVLKFKQGFGRLVRHREDRGVVLVLDTRIRRRGYGRRFLASLPEGLAPSILPIRAMMERVAAFFAQRPLAETPAPSEDPAVAPSGALRAVFDEFDSPP
jgi:ATP-dependent DNA helicase DinG